MATPAFDPASAPGPAGIPAVAPSQSADAKTLVVSSQALTRCCASAGSCSYPSCRCNLPLAKTIQ